MPSRPIPASTAASATLIAMRRQRLPSIGALIVTWSDTLIGPSVADRSRGVDWERRYSLELRKIGGNGTTIAPVEKRATHHGHAMTQRRNSRSLNHGDHGNSHISVATRRDRGYE